MADDNTQELRPETLVQEEESRRLWINRRDVVESSRYWRIQITLSNDQTDTDLERLWMNGLATYVIISREIGSLEGCNRLDGYIQFVKKHTYHQVSQMIRHCVATNFGRVPPLEVMKYLQSEGDYFEYGIVIPELFIIVQ